MTEYTASRLIVSALIKKDDKYLFIKQKKEGGAYPGTLHIPGGGLERGERPDDGIQREILEETGVTVKALKAYDFDTDITTYKGEQTLLVFLRYLCDYAGGEAVARSDASEIFWLDRNEINAAKHNPPSQRLLRKLGLLD